ncbi:MAG: hypothetical protein LC623_01865 [Halobacteriales archaeon]|nr:hypothetical protein [Halobacteriales archaeon]
MAARAERTVMTRLPTRILLLSAEPCQSDYVETVLAMEPHGFQVRRGEDTWDGGDVDLCIVALDAGAPVAPDALLSLPVNPARVPTIAVSPWMPEVAEVHQLMREGAEDVLGLAELSPRRLLSAIVKALARQARPAAAPRGSGRVESVAGLGVALPGHHPWMAAETPLLEGGEPLAAETPFP